MHNTSKTTYKSTIAAYVKFFPQYIINNLLWYSVEMMKIIVFVLLIGSAFGSELKIIEVSYQNYNIFIYSLQIIVTYFSLLILLVHDSLWIHRCFWIY